MLYTDRARAHGARKGERVKPPKDRLSYVRFFDMESLRVSPITFEPSIVEKVANVYRKDVIITGILENYRECHACIYVVRERT